MEGLTPRYAQAPLPRPQEEEEEAVEVEEEAEEVVEEVEGEVLEEHSLNPSIKGMSESKECYPKNSKETAPKPKNSLKICEATSV